MNQKFVTVAFAKSFNGLIHNIVHQNRLVFIINFGPFQRLFYLFLKLVLTLLVREDVKMGCDTKRQSLRVRYVELGIYDNEKRNAGHLLHNHNYIEECQ